MQTLLLLVFVAFRLVGSAPVGPPGGGSASVQRAEGGQHGGGEGAAPPPLPFLRPHVLVVAAAEPQPQQPGEIRTAAEPPEPGQPSSLPVFLQSCTSHYNAGTWGIVQGQLRPLLAPRVYTLPMVRSIGKTMVQGKNYGPQITVKRISTRSVTRPLCKPTLESRTRLTLRFLSPPRLPSGRKCKPIFVQIARQVVKLNASDLRLPSRAWKVKLVGEGADDAGGVFDDTITEMCQVLPALSFPHQLQGFPGVSRSFQVTDGGNVLQELETGVVDLLIPSPNATAEVGYNRDR